MRQLKSLMKYFITFSLILIFSLAALAQEVFLRDVPENHWASDSVYKLVRLGITSGYPDGTFRGKKEITRYEMAAFLAKFAQAFNLKNGKDEKLLAELKAEAASIYYQIKKEKEETKVSGSLQSRARVTTINPRGGKLDYRLKFSVLKTFDPDSQLKITLDTVDAGFNTSGGRPLSTKLLDFESRFKMAQLDWKINLGPGVVVHTEDSGFFPSENYTIYIRPKSAIQASKTVGKVNLSGSYVTRQVATSGKIGVHEFTVKAGVNLGDLRLSLRPRYMFIIGGDKDVLAEAGIDLKHNDVFETNLLVAAGDFSAGRSGWYVKFIEKINNLFGSGTKIVLRADKIGSKYRHDVVNEYEFVYLNNFNRLILDGTVDIGLKMSRTIGDKVSLEWKGDYVTTGDYKYGQNHPGTYFLWQLTSYYNLTSKTKANVFYRAYNVPSGVAQFSQAVPAFSDMIGIGLSSSF